MFPIAVAVLSPIPLVPISVPAPLMGPPRERVELYKENYYKFEFIGEPAIAVVAAISRVVAVGVRSRWVPFQCFGPVLHALPCWHNGVVVAGPLGGAVVAVMIGKFRWCREESSCQMN